MRILILIFNSILATTLRGKGTSPSPSQDVMAYRSKIHLYWGLPKTRNTTTKSNMRKLDLKYIYSFHAMGNTKGT